MNQQSPLERFYHWESQTPKNLYLRQPVNDRWHEYSYQKAGDEIRRIAAALKSLNYEPGTRIALLSKNCAHWIMADYAIWMAGYVSVPLYPTLTSKSITKILDHSEAKAIFVGKLDGYEQQREGISESIQKISFPLYGIEEGLQWNDLIKKHDPIKENIVRNPEEMMTIMYTSGTTGMPKGVMINFKAMEFVVVNGIKKFKVRESKEHFFSYLPLSHIAERILVQLIGTHAGSTINFAESLEKFAGNLQSVQPTIFLGVPRIWAKFQEGVMNKMPTLDTLLKIPLVNSTVRRLILKKLGLMKAKMCLTGAAPIPVASLKWFQKIGIEIHDIYGMTENLAYSHGNLPDVKFGTVGRAWDDIEVRLSAEGEIQTRHPGHMMGYYKEPALTAEAFTEDGYLRTGDKAEMDADGYYRITGRIKDLFKTDKGKYIAPAPIEEKLSANTDIDQVCVVGMGIPQPIALIVLSPAGKAKSKEQIIESLSKTLTEVNTKLENYEKLETGVIMHEAWTVENNLMTPTLKIRRTDVEKIYLPHYPKWYAEKALVVWE
ncbi:MAG: AMP-binding protein [Flammeovirgaceae bacterium]|nr:AMP-binding protein [Flammeovirgaceae bacterium]